MAARPLQAALASAATFESGALLPVAVTALAPVRWIEPLVPKTALVLLAVIGGIAARIGGAPVGPGAWRVAFWGALALAISALVGRRFGATV